VAWPDLLGVLRDCAGEVGEVCGRNGRHDQEASVKLSEALRLGSMQVRPTNHGDNVLTVHDVDGRPCAACALGTIAIAAGVEDISILSPDGVSLALFPLLGQDVPSPVGGNPLVPMPTAINYLFEHERWTREQIADWVETIEAKYEQPAKEQPQPVIVEA
jgi:hypothetical protein